MIPSINGAHAKSYFAEALQKADYYINDQELQGQFYGKLSGRIGLNGAASKEAFYALCENVNPVTGRPLTPRTKAERRVGYDINFHCPKSVSIVHALSGDTHILKAFEASVTDTMRDIEADMQTRVRRNGAYAHRQTGEMVFASFTHQTSRPTENNAPDPHLHAHCFAWNATWDEKEGRIKAGEFGSIMRDMPWYESRFHKNLSDKLMDLGYQIRRTEKSFEIAGVPKSAIELFSKRTDEIGRVAEEKGIHDAKRKSELGVRTRAKKQKGLSMQELREDWRRQIGEHVTIEAGEGERLVRYAPKVIPEHVLLPDDCIDYAVRHSFERASVIQDRRLLETAYRRSIGTESATLDGITQSFEADSRFIKIKEKGKTMCTTKPVLAEEQRMVALARDGQGKVAPLYDVEPVTDASLNAQQQAAVAHVMTTSHQTSIIRGAAGAGKTTLLREVKRLYEAAGKEVFAVAPTAEASRGGLVQEGFKNAETVSRLIMDKELQGQLKDQVLFVDEAGLLGTKDMTALLAITQQQNARLILVGDTRQHSSIGRGDALRILNTVGGIPAAEVSKIIRQRNVHHRAAVEDLAKGDVHAAFIKLSSIGAIKNVDPTSPNKTLVDDYMKLATKGKNVLVVSPTHEQGDKVTGEIRERLKANARLGKKEIKALKLTGTNMTEAEKSDWQKFKKGQVIQFSRNAPQIKRGSLWTVQETSPKAVVMMDAAGKSKAVPLDKTSAFEVYEVSELSLAKGDKVRITRNGFDRNEKRLNNGQSFDVVAISKSGQIQLRNSISKSSYELDKDFGHLSHAYCTTSHNSQSKTVDEVLIAQPSATFVASNAKQFYVSVSRGRDAATIYTDDRKALLEYASQIGDRQSAMELTGSVGRHQDLVIQQERNAYAEKAKAAAMPDKEIVKQVNRYDYGR